MMMKKEIGFSQRIRLEWLDYAAHLVRDGKEPQEMQAALQELLSKQLSIGGTAQRGNREKAITIILRTWATVSKELIPLRDDALRLFETVTTEERTVLHWGMCSAAYPFWASVADITGRLLRLQHEAAISQIQRRVREQYGERETVARSVRRIVRAFADWDVLIDGNIKGVYLPGRTISSNNTDVTIWLVEAMLHANDSTSLTVESLRQLPALFPFELQWPNINILDSSPRLKVFRQGMAEDIVELQDNPGSRRF